MGEERLARMARSLTHRGPDDEGIEVLDGAGDDGLSLGLVHRRLSIIDLSTAGHQPMTDVQTGNRIVYNGEIYNFREIRQELEQRGYTFAGHSDTEVILKAYGCFGIECLHRFRGMFAFAIWDARARRLFLAVDRFGIKPLYVYEADGRFAFSSELRTLLKSGLVPAEVEPLGVESFLAYGTVQAPLTMVKGVQAMLPGQYLLYDVARRSSERITYWQPARSASREETGRPEQIVERMREILADSVAQHLVSDVPVGLFLSGGVDSSAIVALANAHCDGALQSFSVTFAEERFSEEKYSDLIAERYCRHHTRIRMGAEDLAGFLPGALEAMDQPTIDGINVYAISQAVRQRGIKVVLSGQGGDEVFGGYSSFRQIPQMLAAQAVFGRLPRLLRSVGAATADVVLRQHWIGSKIGQFLRSDRDRLATYLTWRQLFSLRSRERLLPGRRDVGVVNGLPTQVAEAVTARIKELDAFDCVSVLELQLFLANTLLRDGDFMSMAHGLEVRVPFLDHRIVEFALSVPSALKSARGVPKPLLLRAMGESLPSQIWQRPKMGFFLPWDSWLRRRLRPQIEDVLESFPEDNALGLDMPSCRTVWRKFLAGAPGVTWARAWALYVLISWYRRNLCAN